MASFYSLVGVQASKQANGSTTCQVRGGRKINSRPHAQLWREIHTIDVDSGACQWASNTITTHHAHVLTGNSAKSPSDMVSESIQTPFQAMKTKIKGGFYAPLWKKLTSCTVSAMNWSHRIGFEKQWYSFRSGILERGQFCGFFPLYIFYLFDGCVVWNRRLHGEWSISERKKENTNKQTINKRRFFLDVNQWKFSCLFALKCSSNVGQEYCLRDALEIIEG